MKFKLHARLFYRSFLLALAAFTVCGCLGCSHTPTQTTEVSLNPIEGPGDFDLGPIVIHPSTVVIDTRPLFTYAMGHIPGAIAMNWTDYSKPTSPYPGVLDPDYFSLTRRLARLGITPQSDVVVLGLGPKGDGSEGRIAWMLRFLGVKHVRFASEDYFKTKLTTKLTPIPHNAPMWHPRLDKSLLATRKELRAKTVRVLDVRPASDYIGASGFGRKHLVPDLHSVNIDWHQFLTDTGRPDAAVLLRVKALGLRRSEHIVVVSAKGVSSAEVTMALRAFGYNKAANYAGGLAEFIGAQPLPKQAKKAKENPAVVAAPATAPAAAASSTPAPLSKSAHSKKVAPIVNAPTPTAAKAGTKAPAVSATKPAAKFTKSSASPTSNTDLSQKKIGSQTKSKPSTKSD